MSSAEARQRKPLTAKGNELLKNSTKPPTEPRLKHGIPMQLLRSLLLSTWFDCCCCVLMVTQFVGAPLYFIHKDYYYSYMAHTKQCFGLVITAFTEWGAPTLCRVSGDASVQGQLQLSKDGLLQTQFPERLVLIANHQVYTDWIYLWWFAYTNVMHGRIFIILKESLRYIPVIGTGMMFYGFIFMARKWASDKPRLQHRLEKLKTRHSGSKSERPEYDPMWLMIFPEGTNLSINTKRRSDAYGAKQGLPSFKHQILPRTTGLFFCLQQLRGTVEWVYDSTIAYEGPPYVFTLTLQGDTDHSSTAREVIQTSTSPSARHIFKGGHRVLSICTGDVSPFQISHWTTKKSSKIGLLLAGPRKISCWITSSRQADSPLSLLVPLMPSMPVRSKKWLHRLALSSLMSGCITGPSLAKYLWCWSALQSCANWWAVGSVDWDDNDVLISLYCGINRHKYSEYALSSETPECHC